MPQFKSKAMLLKAKISGTVFTNRLTKTLFIDITLAGGVFIGKVNRNLKMIAVQLEQVNNAPGKQDSIRVLILAAYGIK